MKKIVSIFLVLGLNAFCFQTLGQTTDEWMRQKSTQRKYLLQQIAALRTYGSYLKKGYNVVKDGSGAIKDITGGEFNLHNDYLSSLKNVNPVLLRNGKVEAIFSMQESMEQIRKQCIKKTGNSSGFNEGEVKHTKRLLDGLEQNCDTQLEELLLVITNGKLELSDDERIKRINGIYKETQKLYATHRSTEKMISAVAAHRKREVEAMQRLMQMHGIER